MDKKLKKDISWNMVGFIIIGASGIVLNILIGRFYGAGYLGVFNLIFSVYIFLSQIAVFGVHQSTLKYISHAHCNIEISQIGYSALVITSFIALSVTMISISLSEEIGYIFSSKDVENSWKYIAIGLYFFAMNKVLLSIVNALRHMRFFAVSQALRYILALIILFFFILNNISGEKLGLIISGTEIILFIVLMIYVFSNLSYLSLGRNNDWIRKHFIFGWHSIIGGIMGEINTRVDILILGIFVSDSMVGVYTIALMIFEGFIQLTVVFRNNFNPVISKLIYDNRMGELLTMIRAGKRKVYIDLAFLILISLVVYPSFIEYFLGNTYYYSVIIYFILMLGVFLSCGYLPFNMLLTQAGYPFQQSLYLSSLVIINILLNFIFIYHWGLLGAAISTASVYIINVFILKFFVKRNIGISI